MKKYEQSNIGNQVQNSININIHLRMQNNEYGLKGKKLSSKIQISKKQDEQYLGRSNITTQMLLKTKKKMQQNYVGLEKSNIKKQKFKFGTPPTVSIYQLESEEEQRQSKQQVKLKNNKESHRTNAEKSKIKQKKKNLECKHLKQNKKSKQKSKSKSKSKSESKSKSKSKSKPRIKMIASKIYQQKKLKGVSHQKSKSKSFSPNDYQPYSIELKRVKNKKQQHKNLSVKSRNNEKNAGKKLKNDKSSINFKHHNNYKTGNKEQRISNQTKSNKPRESNIKITRKISPFIITEKQKISDTKVIHKAKNCKNNRQKREKLLKFKAVKLSNKQKNNIQQQAVLKIQKWWKGQIVRNLYYKQLLRICADINNKKKQVIKQMWDKNSSSDISVLYLNEQIQNTCFTNQKIPINTSHLKQQQIQCNMNPDNELCIFRLNKQQFSGELKTLQKQLLTQGEIFQKLQNQHQILKSEISRINKQKKKKQNITHQLKTMNKSQKDSQSTVELLLPKKVLKIKQRQLGQNLQNTIINHTENKEVSCMAALENNLMDIQIDYLKQRQKLNELIMNKVLSPQNKKIRQLQQKYKMKIEQIIQSNELSSNRIQLNQFWQENNLIKNSTTNKIQQNLCKEKKIYNPTEYKIIDCKECNFNNFDEQMRTPSPKLVIENDSRYSQKIVKNERYQDNIEKINPDIVHNFLIENQNKIQKYQTIYQSMSSEEQKIIGFETQSSYIKQFLIYFCDFIRYHKKYRKQLIRQLQTPILNQQSYLKAYRINIHGQLDYPFLAYHTRYNSIISYEMLNQFLQNYDYYEPPQLVSKNIQKYFHYGLMDGLNQALDYVRRHGQTGQFRYLFGQMQNLASQNLKFHEQVSEISRSQQYMKNQNILNKCLGYTIQRIICSWVSCICGFINDNPQKGEQLTDENIKCIHEKRQVLMLEQYIHQIDRNTINYTLEKIDVKLNLASLITADILLSQMITIHVVFQ